MWIRRLTLEHYRNYSRQELALDRGTVLVLGDNAEGKSNLLEAAFLLATTRAGRAGTDGELIQWDVLGDEQPVARVSAEVERADGPVELEVLVVGRPRGGERSRVPASKRLRVNGVAKRQADMVGQLIAVLFSTHDLELIGGAPAERRRYLDITLSQLDRGYTRALAAYGKVVTQRNALLRRIQEGEAKPAELDFWDDELAGDGALIVCRRAGAVEALAARAREAHARLSADRETLAIEYRPRLDAWSAGAGVDETAEALRAALRAGRRHDIGAGMTLAGPHRDDLGFLIDGVPAASFGSRGQQRTAALALRLAEARFMAGERGDLPVVLLDDVLSELDGERRHAVLESLGGWDQLVITSADPDRFGEGMPATTQVFHVDDGRITPAS